MKLCLFAGTFNPIHRAHLAMAEYVLDNFGFDKILFIPAYKPPHKNYYDNMSMHRLEMVKLATQNNTKFEVSDIEPVDISLDYYENVTKLISKKAKSGKFLGFPRLAF